MSEWMVPAYALNRRALAGAKCWVYFVRGGEGAVKIGITSGPPLHRWRDIQNQSPVALELAAVMPGSPAWEKYLHACFADVRLHGEWFRESSRISWYISGVLRRYGAPDPEYGIPEITLSLMALDDRVAATQSALEESRRVNIFRESHEAYMERLKRHRAA